MLKNLLAFILFLPVLAANAVAGLPAWEELQPMVQQQAKQLLAWQAHVSYVADSRTEVILADGKVDRVVESIRQVSRTGTPREQTEYLEMKVNGSLLTHEQMQAEVAKARGQAGKSPFLPGEMEKYVFTVESEATQAGVPVWVVSFTPKAPGPGVVNGRGFIHRETADLVRLEFSPSELPGVMKYMQAGLDYAPQIINNDDSGVRGRKPPDIDRKGITGASATVSGEPARARSLGMVPLKRQRQSVWPPAAFAMDLRIKVAFIFTLADQTIKIRETYRDYFLLSDSASTSR